VLQPSLLIDRPVLAPFVYSSNSKPHQYVPDRLRKRTRTTKLKHNPKKAIFGCSYLRSPEPSTCPCRSNAIARALRARCPARKVGSARGRPHKSDRIIQHNCLIRRKSLSSISLEAELSLQAAMVPRSCSTSAKPDFCGRKTQKCSTMGHYGTLCGAA
jgi:hypothetical protein